MKKYKGQSLAIVLVLLIVASVIGFAMYARMIRDSERVVDEKASSEANELAETVVGLISTSSYEKLLSEDVLEFLDCLETFGDQPCRRSNLSIEEIEEYLSLVGLSSQGTEGLLSSFDIDVEEGYCIGELAMRHSFESDEVTIEQDNAYSIFLHRVDWNVCSIDFYMTGNDLAQGFVMSTFYGNHDLDNIVEYKEYQFADIEGFSYLGVGGNWTSYNSGIQALNFPGVYPSTKEGYLLHEVRFKSLGSSSNLRWEASNCDIDQYLLMEVGMTCGGKYAGKTFTVPSEVFAPALFDYVLFNGTGELRPESIPE